MNKTTFLVIFCLYMLSAQAVLSAEKTAPPYGDYCPSCCRYGACNKFLSETESRDAIEQYYKNKGITVGTLNQKGRFIQVDILKDGKVQDRILFDRKTGRIRSIY